MHLGAGCRGPERVRGESRNSCFMESKKGVLKRGGSSVLNTF